MKKTRLFPDQALPLVLTAVVFFVVSILLYIEIYLLNRTVITREHIVLHLRWSDILIGLTIYLKTSIDFAIYIGRLMAKYPGWKNRVMIEIGTAVGNALGTLAILVLWDLFREVRILMALMIVVAALVLFRLAEEGLEHVKDEQGKYKVRFCGIEVWFERVLSLVNLVFAPIVNRLVPKLSIHEDQKKGYRTLFLLSFTIPFILGLDDFAGYIPLFNIVNVFGFGVGVFLGHMILNIFLFLSPSRTIKMVKHPVISFVGSVAFVGLAVWGLVEAIRLFVR